MHSRYLYSGISAGCFLLSILPILPLQQGVLKGVKNEFRYWLCGGLFFLSWTQFTMAGCSAYYLAIQNWDVHPWRFKSAPEVPFNLFKG